MNLKKIFIKDDYTKKKVYEGDYYYPDPDGEKYDVIEVVEKGRLHIKDCPDNLEVIADDYAYVGVVNSDKVVVRAYANSYVDARSACVVEVYDNAQVHTYGYATDIHATDYTYVDAEVNSTVVAKKNTEVVAQGGDIFAFQVARVDAGGTARVEMNDDSVCTRAFEHAHVTLNDHAHLDEAYGEAEIHVYNEASVESDNVYEDAHVYVYSEDANVPSGWGNIVKKYSK